MQGNYDMAAMVLLRRTSCNASEIASLFALASRQASLTCLERHQTSRRLLEMLFGAYLTRRIKTTLSTTLFIDRGFFITASGF